MSRRKKSDGLQSKVVKYKLRKDSDGIFVGYCEFQYHRGIVLNDCVCEKRNCKYYLKLYIGSRGRLEDLE